MKFEFTPEIMQIVPLRVTFLGLPIYYWSEENLSRMVSIIRKLVGTNCLTLELEHILCSILLIEVDVT